MALPPPPKGYDNLGDFIVDEVVKNMVKIPTDAISGKGGKTAIKSIDKHLFKKDGDGKIETKDGNLKIDTKDTESMRLAAEFRRNYKKSPECLEPISEEISIKCANEYIRARKAAIKQ